MDFASIIVPAAAVRRKPRHQSEMTNQLLFGESVKILKEKDELWVKVRSLHDGYEGWLTRHLIGKAEESTLDTAGSFVTGGLLNTIDIKDAKMQIPLGATLPALERNTGVIAGTNYAFEGFRINRREQEQSESLIRQLSFQWLNAPYLWGGRTILGVDCSGFVQVNFKMMGIDLPRDAWQQAQQGRLVKKLKDAECGDLAFFDDKEEIVHVGILLGPDQIIHASGKVRVDSIDKKGIINGDTGKRSHTIRIIKRYSNITVPNP